VWDREREKDEATHAFLGSSEKVNKKQNNFIFHSLFLKKEMFKNKTENIFYSEL